MAGMLILHYNLYILCNTSLDALQIGLLMNTLNKVLSHKSPIFKIILLLTLCVCVCVHACCVCFSRLSYPTVQCFAICIKDRLPLVP